MSVHRFSELPPDPAVRHALHVRTRQESSQVFPTKILIQFADRLIVQSEDNDLSYILVIWNEAGVV